MTAQTKSKIEELAGQRRTLIAALESQPTGLAWCIRHSDLADAVVQTVLSRSDADDRLLLVATGGYGRRELAPHSDVDVIVVPRDPDSPKTDQAVRAFFTGLHEAFNTQLGMDVGYAYCPLSDVPGLDSKTLSGLMDARRIAGPQDLLDQLLASIRKWLPTGQFLIDKLRERAYAVTETNDTPLVVEPHLKLGAGGLRDLHTAQWIMKSVGSQEALPQPQEQILLVRNLLQAAAVKRQDLLTRAKQADLADRLRISVGQLSDGVASALLEHEQAFRSAVATIAKSSFQLAPGIAVRKGQAHAKPTTNPGILAVGIAAAANLNLQIASVKLKPPAKIAGPEALEAVSTGRKTLLALDRCGILQTLLPEFTRCRTLMPSDPIHRYSVFEHTLRLIAALDDPAPAYLVGLRASLARPQPLHLAALLHDAGKFYADEDHSVVGERLTHEVAERWGLNSEVENLAAWLVRDHLVMARFIQLRDVMNPDTAAEFAAIVQTRERLDMLALLTYADIESVAPAAWTPANETFLIELHRRTAKLLEGESDFAPDPGIHRRRLIRALQEEAGSEAEIAKFIESLPAHYLSSSQPELVRLHMAFAARAAQGTPTVELHHRPDVSATELTVCALDERGLLSRILGVIYALDLRVDSIRACTAAGKKPIALDTFAVAFNDRPLPSATAQHLTRTLQQVLAHEKTVEDVLTARGMDPNRVQNVFHFQFTPGAPGILEIRAPRGRGMPYRISRLIAENGWDIASARVGQWAGQAAATFYILGPSGAKLTSAAVKKALQRSRLST